jgi:hypothetical protein
MRRHILGFPKLGKEEEGHANLGLATFQMLWKICIKWWWGAREHSFGDHLSMCWSQ